jgi:SM-20-related protein
MPSPDFFAQLGLFVHKNYFDELFCKSLIDEMRSSPQNLGGTYDHTGVYVRDRKIRNVDEAYISEDKIAEVDKKILPIKPHLENHFNIKLGDYEMPQYGIYKEGGFLAPHRDIRIGNESGPGHLKKRSVSFVIFLNSIYENTKVESFAGGELTFYGLIDNPHFHNCGLGLQAETGLLIAFRPDIVHEVKPVISGARYTISSWFLSDVEKLVCRD